VTGLLLREALRVIEPGMHGPAVGIHGPPIYLYDFPAFLVRFFDRMTINFVQRHARELIAAVVSSFRAIQLGRAARSSV
jgi:hypothetical protein